MLGLSTLAFAGAPATKPKVAIVIDDLMLSPEHYQALVSLPVSLNFAVIPSGAYSSSLDALITDAGQELLVHMPMQAQHFSIKGSSFLLTVGMSEQDISYNLNGAYARLPHAKGLNNHVGSRFTERPVMMQRFANAFAQIESERSDAGTPRYFLDSRTTGKSVAYDCTRAKGIASFKRQVFLDGVGTPAYVRKQLYETLQIAQRKGFAIAIGHPRPETMQTLIQMLPELKNRFEFVHLSDMINPN